jgi:nuclear GTP-binding protein
LKNARAIVEDDAEEVGVASLGAKLVNSKIKPRPVSEEEKGMTEEEEVLDEVPLLINRDLPTLQSVLEKADVVLKVVDARDPMVFRSEHVEQLAKDAEKKVLLVLNKIGEYSTLFLGVIFGCSFPPLCSFV